MCISKYIKIRIPLYALTSAEGDVVRPGAVALALHLARADDGVARDAGDGTLGAVQVGGLGVTVQQPELRVVQAHTTYN